MINLVNYHTFANSDRGKMKILSFTRDVPESWTEAKRCVEVTKRFLETYQNEGKPLPKPQMAII